MPWILRTAGLAAALGAAGWATPRPTPNDTTARGLALLARLALGEP